MPAPKVVLPPPEMARPLLPSMETTAPSSMVKSRKLPPPEMVRWSALVLTMVVLALIVSVWSRKIVAPLRLDAKSMVVPGCALAKVMAASRPPAAAGLALVTVKVEGQTRSSRTSSRGRTGRTPFRRDGRRLLGRIGRLLMSASLGRKETGDTVIS